MAYFPIFTDISQKRCIIVGGGKVALRKIETLLKYDADIVVVAKNICEEIANILPKESLHIRQARKEDLAGGMMVIAATSSREVNHQIYEWCRELNILVNVIDAPEECTFLFPSVVKRGDISIGINTAGKSPIISKQIRKNIEEAVPDYFEQIADQLGEVRRYVKEHIPEEKDRRRILKNTAARAFSLGRILTKEELSQELKE